MLESEIWMSLLETLKNVKPIELHNSRQYSYSYRSLPIGTEGITPCALRSSI